MGETHPPSRPGFSDYFSKRAAMSFWPTREVAYRVGAVLAMGLRRLGFSANAVTVMSLLVSVGGTAAALHWLDGALLQAIGIFLAMGMGYALDCSDGMIARVHGHGSLFGAIFDKVADVLAIVLCAALLAGSAIGEFAAGAGAALCVFGTGMAVRLALGTAMWLKEFVGSPPDRPAGDVREKNASWWLRRLLGGCCDHALYVVLIAASWAAGIFWTFFVFYHLLLACILCGYLFVLKRECGSGRTPIEPS